MSYQLHAPSYELQATSYELQATSYELRDMSYKLEDTRYKIAPALADNITVQPLDRSMIIQCRTALYIDRIQMNITYQRSVPADGTMAQVIYRSILSRRRHDFHIGATGT